MYLPGKTPSAPSVPSSQSKSLPPSSPVTPHVESPSPTTPSSDAPKPLPSQSVLVKLIAGAGVWMCRIPASLLVLFDPFFSLCKIPSGGSVREGHLVILNDLVMREQPHLASAQPWHCERSWSNHTLELASVIGMNYIIIYLEWSHIRTTIGTVSVMNKEDVSGICMPQWLEWTEGTGKKSRDYIHNTLGQASTHRPYLYLFDRHWMWLSFLLWKSQMGWPGMQWDISFLKCKLIFWLTQQ